MDQLTEREAAALALALVAVATASVDGGEDAQSASEGGLVELVDEMCDVPLTERQASVIETMGTASAALTAGLGAALAGEHGCDVADVLRLAARAVIGQTPGDDKRAA
ncbi:hypothetical protein GCM10025867_11750 [Frondihabitans sucicola]|uniref:ANTAR domain-containing protein n=1 Tax=Frondihabitans sucicola TaxID=1268041 RepID=A0ABM8GKM2_9MICO|nr:hypothetical protein [Frondihabitans sucicola]BDZ48934.1 hypothetical protein GCM10025867_11750 [Frondihabitans sucicola]